MADYKITLLKGDGIGPEIVNQAVKVLDCAAEKFGFGVTYDEALLGGCAIDATGVPLPDETVAKCSPQQALCPQRGQQPVSRGSSLVCISGSAAASWVEVRFSFSTGTRWG